MSYPKFNVPFSIMEQLFSFNGFLHNSRKELLSPDFTYYITKSEDGKYLVLMMKHGEEIDPLTSLLWDGDYDKGTNPWLKKNIHSSFDPNQLELPLADEKPFIKKHYGMNEWH